MSQDPEALAREQLDAFNAGDWDRMGRSLAEDAVYEELATGRRVEGRDAIIELNRGWKAAFPDAHGTVGNVIVKGDQVVMEITWEGTHSGPLAMPAGEIPPTGRTVKVPAVQVSEVRDGLDVSTRHYFDMLGMLEQLGAMEALSHA